MLEMDQSVLAERANLSRNTVVDFEKGRRNPSLNNLAAISAALEAAGVVFVAENGDGAGVRLKKAAPTVAALGHQIEALEAKAASIPDTAEASPEAAMNVMKKAVVENELVRLRNKRKKLKRHEDPDA